MSFIILLFGLMLASFAHAKSDKPNILVIWGDDIDQSNIFHGTNVMNHPHPRR